MRRAVVRGGTVEVEVDMPERRRERMRGLIARAPGPGLLLARTRSVHTFGMRRSIDVVLLSTGGVVVDVLRLPPRRILLPRRGVRHVVELARSPFAPGDAVEIRVVSGQERSDRRDDQERDRGQGGGDGGDGPPGPCGERNRLPATCGRLDQTEVLQELPHGVPSARDPGR